jgi:replicative superfamily II helicase
MGLNMPAKAVVFTQVSKWDGESHRVMTAGEYTQMSGRAGRRGMDEFGLAIVMIDGSMDATQCEEMMLGKASPLVRAPMFVTISNANSLSSTVLSAVDELWTELVLVFTAEHLPPDLLHIVESYATV